MVTEKNHIKVKRHPAFRKNIASRINRAKSNLITLSIVETCKDFCNETGIHGCHFLFEKIGDEGNPVIRKLRRVVSLSLWLTLISVGGIFGIYLMLRVWTRYQTTPTIMTIETNNYPIWNVAFPGVTICNVNAVYEPNIRNISKELLARGFNQSRIDLFFQSLDALINFRDTDFEFLRIFQTLQEIGYTTERLMFNLAQPCELFIKRCSWLGKEHDCVTLFRLTKSANGYCCSFNYKALRSSLEIETKADDYYQINAPIVRISGAGEDVGLRVHLNVETNSYIAAKRYIYGAEVIIHDPEDFPEKSLLTAFGQPGYEVSIAITPSVVVTADNVQSLPLNLRFCRFADEKRLRITKKYSFQSCITECRADAFISKCGCLPFYYPEIDYDNTTTKTRQCTLKDVQCLSENKHFFASLEPPVDMQYFFNKTNIGMACDCLPSCSEQTYNTETFVSQRFTNLNDSAANFNDLETANMTLIKVYFKDLSCIKYRREIFMSWDDLLASFGGIFGLCLGGSVLSIIELCYYATFKLYAKIISNKAKLEKQKQIIPGKDFLLNFKQVEFKPGITKVRGFAEREFLW